MIRIYLTPGEHAHYLDLGPNAPAIFRPAPGATDAEVREHRIKALESVIGFDYPRQRIGDKAFSVYLTRSAETRRWQ